MATAGREKGSTIMMGPRGTGADISKVDPGMVEGLVGADVLPQ